MNVLIDFVTELSVFDVFGLLGFVAPRIIADPSKLDHHRLYRDCPAGPSE